MLEESPKPNRRLSGTKQIAAVVCAGLLAATASAEIASAAGPDRQPVPAAAAQTHPKNFGPDWETVQAMPVESMSEEEIDELIKRIEIRGDETCQSQTYDALHLLGEKAPEYLKMVADNIGVIDCQPSDSGMHVYEDKPRFQVGPAVSGSGRVWYAGAIVHDAYHSKLFSDYRELHPGTKLVPYNVYGNRNGENQCLRQQIAVIKLIGGTNPPEYIRTYIDNLEKVIDTEYWLAPHDDKHW